MEPEARELQLIRNYIEHKAFKVLSDFFRSPRYFDEKDIAYSISRGDLEHKTLKLIRLTRAALIYVSLAIHHEEQKKDHSKAGILSGRILRHEYKV
jgi:hypothetical protein